MGEGGGGLVTNPLLGFAILQYLGNMLVFVTSSQMAVKMATILDFAKNSNLSGKCKYFLLELKHDTIKHFAAFGSVYIFFHRKKVKIRIFMQKCLNHMLLMTSYLVTIATDYEKTILKCISKISKRLLMTA